MAHRFRGGSAIRNLVVILGAGASASCLPTLKWIFADDAVKQYLATDAKDFHRFMKKHIWGPRGVDPNSPQDSLNLEEVLTLLRQWRWEESPTSTAPGRPNNQAPVNFRKNDWCQRQLLGCVYNSVYFGKSGKGHDEYNELLRRADAEFDHVTWASFNWDALLEQAFYWTLKDWTTRTSRLPRCVDGLTGWDGADPKHLLLKLHGSVTWFTAPGGGVEYRSWAERKEGSEVTRSWQPFLAGDDTFKPMIAEPSFFKHEDVRGKPFLLAQWRALDAQLSEADLVLIIGYSLPDGDAMAKQALLTAIARQHRRPTKMTRFVVVDPNSGVQKLYAKTLGAPHLTSYDDSAGFTGFVRDHEQLLPFLAR